ncbi:gamma-glutamyl-gamma-aminobutyrate hydrolase family protein [Deinococcus cellulosilyticus]|uniref:Gamma-glutamyl-gamma-aminobutyrate hydrolase n=1 Tax=Deinococcus cellulosilyticus (strain DSM 18568 / NBRC 106333 / KACC 11606 / 5516J-15) TaxID=1223518 RepID=A0A511NBQ1_DEIC1|nr:gamma-glutamyl-gamma-aminobutyrate hydrolase family protein [Deinococcus cellulosilyticus]GEM49928.1 gamma-glutamyl-gamma-aminobutyrate hydrolase [Deinococcus cellulosilyticus NBRC 106333 = KACC 11606]
MSTPRVGITTSQLIDPALKRLFNGTSRLYAQGVLDAGGSPVLLPNLVDAAELYVKQLDAILFSGGVDLHPGFYGEEPVLGLGEIDEERDAFEVALYHAARKAGLPILGICRGMQVINVFEGGSLYQHLPNHPEFWGDHSQKALPPNLAHEVVIEEGSVFAAYHPELRVRVNSYHHQAVKTLAPTLQVAARSTDGLVEAYQGEGIFAVQWHPELTFQKHPHHLAPFRILMEMLKVQV